MGISSNSRAFLGHAQVQSGRMCAYLRFGRLGMGLESAANVVARWRGYFGETWICGLVSDCRRHSLAHVVSQVSRHYCVFTGGSRCSAKRLGRESRELNRVISGWWKFQLEQVLREFNCFEELWFSVPSHLSMSTHHTVIHSFIFKVFLNSSNDYRHVKYLLTSRSLSSVYLQETLDDIS